MTTITYRDGVMAADSQFGNRNGIRMSVGGRKIHSVKIGRESWFLSYSGRSGWENALHAWAERSIPEHFSGRPYELFVAPDPDEGFSLLAACGARVLIASQAAGWVAIHAPYVAVGSGMEVALGAMWAGAGAVDAVRAAISVDTGSGGEIQHVDVYRGEFGIAAPVA